MQVEGISCHGSAPERGDNAIYKMAEIIEEVKALNDKLHYDEFLGKGTLAVSEIFFNSPSRCAVADMCAISIDRRLTNGETYLTALDQIEALPSVKAAGDNAEVYRVRPTRDPAWTGLVLPHRRRTSPPGSSPRTIRPDEGTRRRLPHANVRTRTPVADKWTFSTNGVSIMGRYGIPGRRLRPRQGKGSPRPQRKDVETGSYKLRCRLRGRAYDVQRMIKPII